MKISKKISVLEVKRAYVLAQIFTSKNMRKQKLKAHRQAIDGDNFKYDLVKAKIRVLKMSIKKLDKLITEESKKRLKYFDEHKWHIVEVRPTEIGVWHEAGGIPKSWSYGSLKDTANRVQQEIKKPKSRYSRKRFFKTIRSINKFKNEIQKERYLYPIVLPGGTWGRADMKKLKGDINDGCMRSIAYTISGDKIIKIYLGEK